MNTTAVIPVEVATQIRNALSDAHVRQSGEVETVEASIPRLNDASFVVEVSREEVGAESVYAIKVAAKVSLPTETPAEGTISTPANRLSLYGSDYERFSQEFARLLGATTAHGGQIRFTIDATDGGTATYTLSERVEHTV